MSEEKGAEGADNSGGFGCSGCLTVFVVLLIVGSIGELLGGGGSSSSSSASDKSCDRVSGVYVGNYHGMSPGGVATGSVGVVVSDDCGYHVSMDGSQVDRGSLEEVGGAEYKFSNGNEVSIGGGTMMWYEGGGGYEIRYDLVKQ